MCNKSKEELKGTNALKYIEFGESKKLQKYLLFQVGKDGIDYLNCLMQIFSLMNSLMKDFFFRGIENII